LKASKWGLIIGLAGSALAISGCGGSSGGRSVSPIIAEGGGRSGLPYTAEPDGSNIKSAVSGIVGAGTPTSQ
jgi:hypothetical protein